MRLDRNYCLRAVRSKDARFDGWFCLAVSTTGIYCRPSCPARTPKPANITFYPTAAAAQQAGYRACKRCRPDATPGSPDWDYRTDIAARALRLIREGVVDRHGITGLAREVGYSVRQLERHFLEEFGAGPQAMARTQRAQTARLLIENTTLTIGDIAFAAGFSSIRAFNKTVSDVFNSTPSELREKSSSASVSHPLALRLPFRRPLCPDNLFGHLVATAIDGVEEWRGGYYRRTVRLPYGVGTVAVAPGTDYIDCVLRLNDLRDISTAINRLRWMLDLDADPVAIDESLSIDERLAPLVATAPGRRVPRSFDSVEMLMRAVIGQQVSTRAARTHAQRLVSELGEKTDDRDGELSRIFPNPEAIAESSLDFLAMPEARKNTIRQAAQAIVAGDLDLSPGCDWRDTRRRLLRIRGIGPWTADVVSMRALGDPDVSMAGDLGARKGARRVGLPDTAEGLARYGKAWSPWRSYAVQYLWAATDHDINRLPESSER
ncbi:AlkA N-terminal domain-containing protein [Haloglycomyces albus]|uniref:AlkA N-terminal domain-containing protein n=1 Tax=Haloglycomyces albus TaxID=526067 RepID=UPI00046CD1D8|nr:AlkA N-terminal domain-containing protein [Haloglycomyces albus]